MIGERQAPLTAEDFRQAADVVSAWQRPVLISHERPDGDALGCLLAMRSILLARGVRANAVLFESLPWRYSFLDGAENLPIVELPYDPLVRDADGVLILDTCAFGQLTPLADWLGKTVTPIVVVDHHQTRDIAPTRSLIDPNQSAASLIVYQWARAVGWELDHAARVALFVGIATDTGWFRYSNTTAACLHVAAELVEQGVDLDELHHKLYLYDPVTSLRARSAALAGLTLHLDETVAIMPVSRRALADAGATPADLDDAVNLPLSAANVEMSVLLVEMEGGVIKCSFRSKGGINVAELASRFGGGGHARAAGARINATLDQAAVMILSAVKM